MKKQSQFGQGQMDVNTYDRKDYKRILRFKGPKNKANQSQSANGIGRMKPIFPAAGLLYSLGHHERLSIIAGDQFVRLFAELAGESLRFGIEFQHGAERRGSLPQIDSVGV